jgi:VWFA-related protein
MRATLSRLTLIALLVASLQAQQPPPQPPPAQNPPPQNPPAQQPPAAQDPQKQPPTFKTAINFVRVDVIVSDNKGNPVLDLKPEEFSVFEDGKPQKIESFSVVKIDPLDQTEGPTNADIRNSSDEEREAARPEVRLFVILLDDYHVRRGNDMAVRKPLIDFIENQLAPADMVAIMYPLTPVGDILFSRSRSKLISAIQNFEGRKFNYTPRNTFEEQYAQYPATTVERIRNQVTMSALKAAAMRMGALREGRKSIIFVSEGFTAALPPQLQDPNAAFPGFGNPNRRNPQAQNDDRYNMQAMQDMFTDMREVFDIANRQNTSIYAVDPRGLGAFEYNINENVGIVQDGAGLKSSIDTLHTLANNTDGRAIVNRNDLAAGMKQIMRDSSGYYLIGYTSQRAPTDGKFHEIKVTVKRRGTDVRARKGYWALSKEDVARATAPPKPEPPAAVMKALSSLAAPRGGRPARFWIGTARGDAGMSRVTIAWEPTANGAADGPVEVAASVAVSVFSREGKPLYKGKAGEAGGKAAETGTAGKSETTPAVAASRGGSVSFEAPPGQIQIRMNIEGERGQILDSETRELTVPDYTVMTVILGTPRFYRGRTVRELQTIRANAASVPTVDREFSRSERILIRVDAYAPGGLAPDVTAKLLNRNGSAMSEMKFNAVDGMFETELPLSALAAGEYLLEITAKGLAGTSQDTVAFRVGR